MWHCAGHWGLNTLEKPTFQETRLGKRETDVDMSRRDQLCL